MVNYLHQQQLEKMWSNGGIEEGVMLKKARDEFACSPKDLRQQREGFFDAVKQLNVKCAMTVNTRIVKLLLRRPDVAYVPLENGLRLQILPNVTYLPRGQKHHFAAFIQDSSILIVWDDDPNHILARAQNIQDQLMNMIWKEEDDEDEKSTIPPGSKTASRAPSIYLKELTDPQNFDERLTEPPRKIVFIQSFVTAITIILMIAAVGAGWRQLAIEISVDKNWVRLALLVMTPIQIWLALVGRSAVTFGISLTDKTVLHASSSRMYFSDHRSNKSDEPEYKVFLWRRTSSTLQRYSPSCHDSMSRLQGGLMVCHRTNCEITQSSHLNV